MIFRNPTRALVASVLALSVLAIGIGFTSKPAVVSGSTTLSVSGAGGAVPDGNAAGASFDINVADPRLIAATGNNVTLTLIGVDTTNKNPADPFNGYGGLVDFTVTLEHVGAGAPQFAFDRVLDNLTFICIAGLQGTYTFRSGEPITLQSQCGPGGIPSQPMLIPQGTYLTTLPNDVTDSGLSSAWNGQPVAGTWRLHISDTNVNTGANQFVMNTTWTWRLDIEVADAGDCKNGQWQAYGIFKNQGDCVSFIQTDGKNEPGQNIPTSKE